MENGDLHVITMLDIAKSYSHEKKFHAEVDVIDNRWKSEIETQMWRKTVQGKYSFMVKCDLCFIMPPNINKTWLWKRLTLLIW